MHTVVWVSLALAVCAVGCSGAGYWAAPARPALLAPDLAVQETYTLLRTPRGPTRFAQVTPSLYRGGQPSRAQLALLRTLGVRTVISLRQSRAALDDERRDAEALGLRFLSFPFSGLDRPAPAQLHAVVAAMVDARGGGVYVHCRQGRDRTSLVVALYRVWHDGWSPDVAWRMEADDYGHGGWRHVFFRKLDGAFAALTHAG